MTKRVINSLCYSKTVRKVIAVVIFAVTMFSMVPTFTLNAYATYETKYGIVSTSSDPLTVREGAGTGNSRIGEVAKGAKVVIVGEETASDGVVWYKIEFSGGYGYVSSDYITLYTPSEDDTTGGETTDAPVDMTDFEAWLTSQNFPESYKDGLRALHAKYPNWVFKADHLSYTWNETIEAQSKLRVSLVENSFPSSWKSTQDGAYNWETSTWIPLDGDRWVQASKEIIAYYLDPRNFMDSETIFQFLEQSFDGNVQTVAGVQSLLDGTFMAGELPDEPGVTYAQLIFDVSKANNVNPYVIASMILTEQGTTGSALCSGTYPGYEGYYNFFNYNAYGSNPVEAGLVYAKNSGWNTVRKSITYGTSSFASGYIAIGQDTLYYKRFDFVEDPDAFDNQYSQSIYSPKVEGELAAEGYSETMRQSALTFTIPVFPNMPETACAKPTGDGSPNIKLSSLAVEGYKLTPSFQPDILEYSLVVPESTSSVTINAVTMDTAASVSGTGAVSLPSTNNTVTLTVTAGNGNTRTYTITIAKESSGIEGVKFSGKYTLIGTYIMASPGTTAAAMKSDLLSTGSVVIRLSDGSSKDASSVLRTGDTVTVYDSSDTSQGVYVVCVKGDVNGDGNVNNSDFIKVRNHILGTNTIVGVSSSAADVNADGKINNSDFIKIRNHLLGTNLLT